MTDFDPRRRFAGIALFAAATFGLASAGAAQAIPEGQSCGGLVCDLGLFGHKTAPQPVAPAPAAPGPAVAVPPPARTATAPEPASETRRPAHKKAHVAKTVAPRAGRTAPPKATAAAAPAFGAPPVAASLAPPPAAAAAPAAPAPAPAAAALAFPPSFAAGPPPPAPVPVTATPAPSNPVVLANPYVYDKPLKFMFQSVDPTQGVQ